VYTFVLLATTVRQIHFEQGRYQFIQFLDSAVFSSALFCVDLADDRDVCLKVHWFRS
jgi:menaquinone-dependent protoporphyrinogen IX oxidase